MAREDGVEVTVVRHHLNLHAPGAERAQDVALDAIIDEDEPQAGPLAQRAARQHGIERIQNIAESLRYLADQVLFLERGYLLDTLEQSREFVSRADDRPLRAGAPQVPGEPPGIAAGQDRDAVTVEPLRDRLLGAPVLMERAELTGDQRPSPRAPRFLEVGRRAVIADQRIGHSDHHPRGGGA